MQLSSLLTLACASFSLNGSSPPDAGLPAGSNEELLPMLAGEWEGTLSYRDFQTDEWSSIRIDETCRTVGKSMLLTNASYFDPTWTLKEVSIQRIDPEQRFLDSSSLSERGHYYAHYQLEELEVAEDGSWSVVLVIEEPDDGRPAEIRVRLDVGHDEQVRTKHVRYLDEGSAKPFRRNEVRLRRVPQQLDPAGLAGRWSVDLRPSPDAPAYMQELELTEDADGSLSGTFYGIPIRELSWNTAWGELRGAFVTEDGTGPYNTTFVLSGDTLTGTTHSVGRGFLSRWTAHRKD